MQILFIAAGNNYGYRGFPDAVRLAEKFGGEPVTVVADVNPGASSYLPIKGFKGLREAQSLRVHPSIVRWFVLEEMIQAGLSLPVFVLDWDVLVFRPLAPDYVPFQDAEWSRSHGSAAYGIHSPECVSTAVRFAKLEPGIKGDMQLWTKVMKAGHAASNISRYTEGAGYHWDHNIHSPEGFDTEPIDWTPESKGRKQVIWRDRKPFFLRGGKPVAATIIHCWGSYKTKTGELRTKAGA